MGGGLWLPLAVESANFQSTVVIDLEKARRRLRGATERQKRRPRILDTLELADAWQARLEKGGVNRAQLAREHGVSRARVTQVLRLLKLDPGLRRWVEARGGELSERMLRPLFDLSWSEQRRRALAGGFVRRRGCGGR